MSAWFVILSALLPAQMGTVKSQRGAIVHVTDAPAEWRVGMPVAVLWSVLPNRQPTVVAHGRVEGMAQGQAVIRLDDPKARAHTGLKVVARFRVESQLFGRGGGVRAVADATTKDNNQAKPMNLRHRPPQKVQWDQPVWFELSLGVPAKTVEVMVRLGPGTPFTSLALKSGRDGHWSASYNLGPPQPSRQHLQYYVAALIDDARVLVTGSPAMPNTVAIRTKPKGARRRVMVHHPPGRWNEREAVVVRAQVDAVYSEPMVHYRGAGEGRYIDLPMNDVGARVFEARVPGDAVLVPRIHYYLSAKDEQGNRQPVYRNAMHPHRLKVVRARLLDGIKKRNRAQVHFETIGRGDANDASQRLTMRYDRAFFPFLLARLGFLRWDESRLQSPAIGGEAGMELRFKDFVSLTGDVRTLAFGTGSAFGYRFGLQVGDEAGAYIGGSYGYAFDLNLFTTVGESLSFSLVVPVSARWQLAGVVQSDDYFSRDEDLRLLTRLSGRFGGHLQVRAAAGMATRGGEKTGLYLGGALGLGF